MESTEGIAIGELEAVSEESQMQDDLRLREIANAYLLQAMNTIPPRKVDEMVADWAKGHLPEDPDDDQIEMMTEIGLDACLFAPSLSGSTPMGRFVASATAGDPQSRLALKVLSRSEIRLVRVENCQEPDLVVLKDMITSERLTLVDSDFVEASEGYDALMRLCRLDSGRYILISFPFALTEASYNISESFRRPGKGIVNPYRYACAVYKHAIREGVAAIPQREPTEDELEQAAAARIAEVSAALDAEWEAAKNDPAIYAEFTEELREIADADGILSYMQIYNLALRGRLSASPDNMRAICTLMIEELARRQSDGDAEAAEDIKDLGRSLAEAVEEGELEKECQIFLDSVLAGKTGKLP